MTSQPISYSLHDDRCVINLSGEINEEMALALQIGLEKFFDYYQYERVTVSINSPGGLVNALRHIIECIQDRRTRGHKISTEGTFCTASAAALLLTFGEIGDRIVRRHTNVLFHHSRVGAASSAITAGGATHLASILKSCDQGMLKLAVNHIIYGFGGIDGHQREGLARCNLLSTEAYSIANRLGIQPQVKVPIWLKSVRTMYRDGLEKKGVAAYIRCLERRFEQDTAMDLREAYALNLLDKIHDVPELRYLTMAGGTTITENIPMTPARPFAQMELSMKIL